MNSLDHSTRALARGNDPLAALRAAMRAAGVGASTLREDLWETIDDLREPSDWNAWEGSWGTLLADAGPDVAKAAKAVKDLGTSPETHFVRKDAIAPVVLAMLQQVENASEEQTMGYWLEAGGQDVFGLGEAW